MEKYTKTELSEIYRQGNLEHRKTWYKHINHWYVETIEYCNGYIKILNAFDKNDSKLINKIIRQKLKYKLDNNII